MDFDTLPEAVVSPGRLRLLAVCLMANPRLSHGFFQIPAHDHQTVLFFFSAPRDLGHQTWLSYHGLASRRGTVHLPHGCVPVKEKEEAEETD